MSASKNHRLALAAQRRQAVLINRPKDAGMPPVIKPRIWEKARNAFFNDRPLTHKQLLQNQMAEAGVE